MDKKAIKILKNFEKCKNKEKHLIISTLHKSIKLLPETKCYQINILEWEEWYSLGQLFVREALGTPRTLQAAINTLIAQQN